MDERRPARPASWPTSSRPGELHVFRAKAVLFATGGYGRMFKVTSNAHALTGDGPAVCYRRGHPARGHGDVPVPPDGHLQARASCSPRPSAARAASCCNSDGERFMERYAPTDQGPRAPRHGEPGDLPGDQGGPRRRRQATTCTSTSGTCPREVIEEKLPDITEFARVYLRRRADDGAGAHPADRALRDGRHPDQRRRPGGGRARGDAGARACTRPASARA